MYELLLSPHSMPFSVALAVVAVLFLLEILSALLGGSILGAGADGPDVDIDLDLDFDLSADIDFDAPEVEMPDIDSDIAGTPSGLWGWLGARDVPFLIWLVSFLTMFGLSGLIIQSIAGEILGTPLYASLAMVVAFAPSLYLTKIIAGAVAAIMPRTETSALKTRFLGGHQGVITQGTSARGKPAEAKIKDRHGNIHYVRVEPLDDDAIFPEGSDVRLIRKRGNKFYVI
ncbi:MAG: YqiJ family protein [Litoreibacter sp.]